MKSLFSSNIQLVGKVMDLELQRQNVISSNMANVNTPNYKPRELLFEEELQKQLELDARGRMSRTSDSHMPSVFNPDSFSADWEKQFKVRQIHGEDRVNIDKEMVKHTKNHMHYNALTQIMAKSFEGIKNIIQESKA